MKLKTVAKYELHIDSPHRSEPYIIYTSDLDALHAAICMIHGLYTHSSMLKIQIIKQVHKHFDLGLLQSKILTEDVITNGLPDWLNPIKPE